MKNTDYMFEAKDKDGNTIDCIGYIFAIELQRKLFDVEEVKRAATDKGIPTKVFKDIKKRTAFTQAITAMTNHMKKRGYVIHKVSDDASSVVYAVDKKIVKDKELNMIASDTNTETTVNTDAAEYETIANFIYDVGNDRVLADSQDRLTELVAVLNLYINSYTKNTFRMKVNDIIDSLGDCIAWRQKGGVYFVPAKHKKALFDVIEMVTALDAGSRVKLGEVPNLSHSKQAVAMAVTEEVGKEVKLVKENLAKLYSAGDLDNKDIVNIITKLSKQIRIVEEYQILTERTMDDSMKIIQEVQELSKEFLLTGKIVKPIIEETKIDDEVADILADL